MEQMTSLSAVPVMRALLLSYTGEQFTIFTWEYFDRDGVSKRSFGN